MRPVFTIAHEKQPVQRLITDQFVEIGDLDSQFKVAALGISATPGGAVRRLVLGARAALMASRSSPLPLRRRALTPETGHGVYDYVACYGLSNVRAVS